MRRIRPGRRWLVTIALLALLTACTSSGTPATPSPGAPSTATAPTLNGTSWVVTGIVGGQTLPDRRPTMAFSGGRVSGLASCNQFSADYTQAGTALKIGIAAQTAMACLPAPVMAQEQVFTAALTRVTGVRASASGLDLLDAAGTVVMTLEPAAPEPDKPLMGTMWQLSGLIAGDAVSSPLAGTAVTFSITGDQLTGKACNSFWGTVQVEGNSFSAGPLASTRMACANPDETTQEQAVVKGIQAAQNFTIAGGTLTLRAADGTALEFRAA